MEKILQKVSHQDSIPTGARKHQKKSQEFRGGESGQKSLSVYIAAGKNFKPGSAGSNDRKHHIMSDFIYLRPTWHNLASSGGF